MRQNGKTVKVIVATSAGFMSASEIKAIIPAGDETNFDVFEIRFENGRFDVQDLVSQISGKYRKRPITIVEDTLWDFDNFDFSIAKLRGIAVDILRIQIDLNSPVGKFISSFARLLEGDKKELAASVREFTLNDVEQAIEGVVFDVQQ